MRNLVHVSDLHFGRSDKNVVDDLFEELKNIRPDVVIISGDLTQRAREEEFEAAKRFIDSLQNFGLRCLVIPGNHDIAPLYRPLKRIIDPYRNYKAYISTNMEASYHDDEIAIASVNTVSTVTIENGAVKKDRIEEVCDWFRTFPESHVKLVVSHHPLYRNPSKLFRKPAWRAKAAIANLAVSGVDAFLSGHLHRTAFSRPGMLSIQAGTVSERLRGELPSFNVIAVDIPHMVVEKRGWHGPGEGFKKGRSTTLLIKNKFKGKRAHTHPDSKGASV